MTNTMSSARKSTTLISGVMRPTAISVILSAADSVSPAVSIPSFSRPISPTTGRVTLMEEKSMLPAMLSLIEGNISPMAPSAHLPEST